MKKVRIIPVLPKENKKLRVVAYCRVSTFRPAQISSLELQIKTYTKMIQSHPNWIFAGVFFDVESGLRRSGRTRLDKMLKKVAKGKIDYIITKSISRLLRDTLEVLKIIRFLRERGINMRFVNITENTYWVICSFAAIAAHLTEGGQKKARSSGDVRYELKKAKMLVHIPLLWMKNGYWITLRLYAQTEFINEAIIRNKVDKIQVFDAFIMIFRTDGFQDKRLFQNG